MLLFALQAIKTVLIFFSIFGGLSMELCYWNARNVSQFFLFLFGTNMLHEDIVMNFHSPNIRRYWICAANIYS